MSSFPLNTWRVMRDVLAGIVAWLYITDLSRAEDARVRELRGLLTLIASEIRSNERILDGARQGAETNLFHLELLSETSWNHCSARAAKLLPDYGLFALISIHYEQLRYLTLVRHTVADEVRESLDQIVEGAIQQSADLRRRIHEQIATLSGQVEK